MRPKALSVLTQYEYVHMYSMLCPTNTPRQAKSFPWHNSSGKKEKNMDRVCGLSLKSVVVTTEGLLLSPFIISRKEIRTIRTVKM